MSDIEDTQEMYVFRVTDPNCGKVFVLPVAQSEHKAWKDGMLIQDAMPSLNKEERELLISGTCPECWQAMMAEPEENSGEFTCVDNIPPEGLADVPGSYDARDWDAS